MNFELKKIHTRGEDKVLFTFSPSDSLETEFFNTLFSIPVEIEVHTNGSITIQEKKEEEVT